LSRNLAGVIGQVLRCVTDKSRPMLHDMKFARELAIRVVLLANGRAPTLPETKAFAGDTV